MGPIYSYVDELKFDVGAGVGGGKLDWNIGTVDRQPDVLSELEWKKLRFWNTRIFTSARILERANLSFEGNYGKIFDGYNEDSDYSISGRKGLYKYSRATANKGEIFDLSLALGYDFHYSNFTITPLAGWEKSEQHVRLMSPSHFTYDGNFDPFDPNDFIFAGSYQDLHSNYRAKWEGPWTGISAAFDWGRFHLIGKVQYHWLDYHGTGHWNLRQEFFGDFHQDGHGGGPKIKVEAVYDVNSYSAVGIVGTYTNYHMKGGVDRVRIYDPFNPDFAPDTIVEARSRVNDVNWESFTLVINCKWQF